MNSKLFSRVLMTVSLVAGAVTLPSTAFATTTEDITVGGTVAATLNIDVVAEAGATTLTMTQGAETIAKIAELSMETNNSTGLTLTATDGDMTNGDGQTIAYDVEIVARDAAAPASGDFSDGGDTYATAGGNALGAAEGERDLYIAFTPAALQDPGAYTGTVSVTVVDNG
ncbi:hypothetical protein IQ266_08770 [filamentous cyanobacterium LEGE 11480]|uniref:Uncharacterized protein n=1 Tax=Romeriopsis navalis LEGE 11480 TaxID=2777977 RepID=A0A928VPM5_9CYAN|nr:hypothetical protein [Romeriopsis navalis]MBE9029819.1 hypothetical protein [Romeriopsis navalis LEGE 11480]